MYLFLIVLILFLSGCKSSRSTTTSPISSDRINIVIPDAGNEPAPTPTTPSTTAYPAVEYYGARWNNDYVSITSDPKPSGTTTLSLIPPETNSFVMPFCGRVISEFGPRNGRMHTGIDIILKKDDPVYCAFDGMVRMAKDYGSYGKVVVVRHHNGLETLYSHLNSIAVKLNQRVKAGDRIGGGGKTGNATGEHLHFETRFKGEPFNPRIVIDFENCRLNSETLSLNDNSYKQYYKNIKAADTKPATTVTPVPIPEPEQKTVEQTAPSPPETTQAAVETEHTVEKGDTLYNISRRYGTTVESLRQLNHLTESSIIEIGQKLIIK